MPSTSPSNDWDELIALEPRLRAWLVRRCRDASELDDIVQETMLRAARYGAQRRDPSRSSGWLARIARNALHDWVRREGRARQWVDPERDVHELALGEVVRDGNPCAPQESFQLGAYRVGKDVALEQMALGLRALRAEDRRLLQAYYGNGASSAHAASECGIPVERVKVRLFRARRRLSRKLARRLAIVGSREAPPEG